jgi:dienelactone hydrolase
MNTSLRSCLCPALALSLALALPAARARDETKPDDIKALARALVAALAKEDWAAAGKDFDDAMKKALPADKLKGTWGAVLGQVGPFQKQAGVRAEKAGKYDAVFVTCRFEKMALDVKVVFDGPRVTGLFFRPARGAFAYKPPPYARPDSFREVEVVVGAAPWALPGTLTLPRGKGPFPAVVLLHGSGPHDRDETIGPNKPLRDLAWGLAGEGVAVLRYEKRTLQHAAKLAGFKGPFTFKEEVVDDALEAVALLRRRPEVDGKRVFVAGHSLGATVAPQVGARDEGLAGLVLLAGNTRPMEDLVLEQMTYILSLKGGLTDKQREELEKIKKQVAGVKGRDLSPDTPASEMPLGVPAPYWLALRAYDPAAAGARLRMPMLVLQGERDYQVTMADFAGWKKALAGRKGVTLKSYPKLNHLFMEGEGKARPAEYDKAGHVAREVVADIAEWVKGR